MAISNMLAIVPAYNEQGRIGPTLELLCSEISNICVIDDGSTDDTVKEASRYDVEIISHEINKGKGQAIKTGIMYFLEQDFEYAIFIDGDGQHNPTDIQKFMTHFQQNPEVDVVIASRFGTEQWQSNMPFMRKVSNLLSRFGIWILYNGLIIEDPQNGFRAYSRDCLENIYFDTDGYEAETEMLIDAYLKGFKIGRIHIESIYDDEGNASKFSLLMDTWKIPGVMVRLFFKRKPFLLRSRKNKLNYRIVAPSFYRYK